MKNQKTEFSTPALERGRNILIYTFCIILLVLAITGAIQLTTIADNYYYKNTTMQQLTLADIKNFITNHKNLPDNTKVTFISDYKCNCDSCEDTITNPNTIELGILETTEFNKQVIIIREK